MITPPDTLIVSDYVICATLRKVPDVFNASMLWERVRSGQDGVFLLEALKRYPRVPRGHQRKETCYSQVIVRIPERDYLRDNRLDEGIAREMLLRELHRLHERDLGRQMVENTAIRYHLEPDPVLRPGEVQFLFGRAIYLPADDELPLFYIQATSEGQADWRELGMIHAGQRLTLLNGDRRAGSFPVVGWPFPNGESILLMLRPGVPALVDVLSEPPGGLNLADDGEGGFIVRDRRGRALRLRVVARSVEVGGVSTVLERSLVTSPRPGLPPAAALSEPLTPLTVPEEPPTTPDIDFPVTDIWGRREPVLGFAAEFDSPLKPQQSPVDWPTPPPVASAAPVSESAAGPEQLTWIPQRPATVVRVAGVALQRLSTYAAAGISDWRICFNRAGGMVPGGHPEAVAWLRIDSADRVFGEVVGLSTPLALPGTWQPFSDLELELHAAPPPMTVHYLGWMFLPTPLALPVPRGRAVSFGRGSEADIAPRLLADPRSLRWDGNAAKTVGINAEYLGLSRRHLQLQARHDDWWVQLESQNMPAYRLTSSGQLLDVLSPGADTTAAAKPGDLLVVGGYVLALGAVA